MRTAFLVHELGRSGGMAMIMERARAMRERDGFDCDLVVTGPKQHDLPAELDGVPVLSMGRARNAAFDVAIATWWATANSLFELKARRHAMYLQNVEHRFYREHEGADRAAAAAVLGLPISYIVIAEFMRDLLAELRPDAPVHLARHGIDKQAFRELDRAPRQGPLRVLVEGQPTLWFKGVPEAVASVRAMSEPATVTLVAHDSEAARDVMADRVVSGLDRAGMAQLYAEHDVLLKLPRFEGFGLPPLEAFHVGLPCVATPFTGSEEYLRHGHNGLVVGFDDVTGTAAALDLLARDEELRARLSKGALRTAGEWPSSAEALDEWVRVMRRLETDPGPDERAMVVSARIQRMETELAREEARRARILAENGLTAYEEARVHALELSRSRDECSEMLDEARATLESVRSERAYRTAVRARKLLFWKRDG